MTEIVQKKPSAKAGRGGIGLWRNAISYILAMLVPTFLFLKNNGL
jgi:hypothetical protein